MTRELVKRVDEFVDKNLPWWEKEEDESLNTCKGVSAKSILETLDTWLDEDKTLKADLEKESKHEDFYELRFRFFLIDNDIDVEEDKDLQSLIDHVVKKDGKDFFNKWYTDLDCDCYMASGKGFKKAMSSALFGAEWYEEAKGKVKDLDDDIIYVADCGTEPTQYHIVGRI